MPRTYKKSIGSRNYKNYKEETLQECLRAIENRELTQRKASEKHGIPRRTIINQLRLLRAKIPSRPPGAPTTFSTEEEALMVDSILKLSDYGFPLTVFDLRVTIRSYLDKIGRKVQKFRDNCPGLDWVASFLKRHHILSQRFAANIKRSRAAVDKDTITDYINNLEGVVENVPPENIWNYDETNLSDDPGQKRVITKRGSKYPEVIRNSSKSSTSIMFAGNAAGELLPPYVVYKSKQMWNTWKENGPKDARYNNSPSGWFDMNLYNDWFFSQALPTLKKQEGVKVLIGDNLSSHISIDVLKACDENNIKFVCLPPNSTHLTQPLDVAFFRPMKVAWRKILTEWKTSEHGIREAVIQKSNFPILLNRLMQMLETSQEDNLKSGFRKSGIYPVDVNPLLERLPGSVDKNALEDAFLESIQAKRLEWAGVPSGTKRRRTKINVTPGKSVTGNLEELLEDKENQNPGPSKSKGLTGTTEGADEDKAAPIDPEPSKRRRRRRASSESTYAESDMSVHNSSDDGSLRDILDQENEQDLVIQNSAEKRKFKPVMKAVGQYVVFTYEGSLFPGLITKITENGPYVSAMKKSLKSWKWPKPIDEIQYKWNEIIGCIEPPKKIGRREFYSVPELDNIWGD